MKELARCVTSIEGSSIRKMFNIAQKMEDVINFGLGEPGFDSPVHVQEAACQAIHSGKTHYTLNSGIPELRAAVAKTMSSKKGVSYDPETEVMITAGGVEALFLSMRVLLNPGDEIIVTTPCFPNYFGEISLCGAKLVMVAMKEENGFTVDAADVEAAVTEKTKAVLINSPSNPTGSVTGEAQLRRLAEVCVKHDLYLITDEVYQDFVYGEVPYFSVATCPGMRERTVIVDSFSKTYAMTGWRCGILLGPEAVISQAVKIQESLVSCVNAPTQYAAIAALEGPQDVLKEMLSQYDANRRLVVSEINQMKGLSVTGAVGAFYAFVNVRGTGLTSEEFAFRLLKEARVVVTPGSGFGAGGEGYVRISYVGTREVTAEGLKRMKAFTDSL